MRKRLASKFMDATDKNRDEVKRIERNGLV